MGFVKVLLNELKWELMFGVISAVGFGGERSIKCVPLVMNIVPCRELNWLSKS